MRAAERACIFVLQRAAQPGEAAVLGRQRIMGMCEKIRERAFSLAGGGRGAEQSTAESRGVGLATGWDRSAGDAATAVVSKGSCGGTSGVSLLQEFYGRAARM